jgi:hypothetical protein
MDSKDGLTLITPIIAEEYTEEDYNLGKAQALLERVEETLAKNSECDRLLYQSLESIILSAEDEDTKESMVVCLLEKFFLRPKMDLGN